MEGKILKCVPNDPIERSPEDILDAEIFENEGEIEIANQGNENQEGGIVIDAGDDEEIENENPTELKATKGAKSKKKVPTKPIKKTDSKKTNQQTTKVPSVKKPPTPKVFVGNAFQKESLEQHNLLRKKHHVDDLMINKELCDIAQKYANKLASTDTFQHSRSNFKGRPMGENLFACYGMEITGKVMSNAWYDEIKDYNFDKPGFKGSTGHFTQVVWKNSKYVGFGFAKSKTGYNYGVANYFPAGNYINEFDKNVFKE